MMTNEVMQMAAAMQRAADYGPQGHAQPGQEQSKPGEKFGQAREVYTAMSADEHAARRFGRNPKGFTPSAV